MIAYGYERCKRGELFPVVVAVVVYKFFFAAWQEGEWNAEEHGVPTFRFQLISVAFIEVVFNEFHLLRLSCECVFYPYRASHFKVYASGVG